MSLAVYEQRPSSNQRVASKHVASILPLKYGRGQGEGLGGAAANTPWMPLGAAQLSCKLIAPRPALLPMALHTRFANWIPVWEGVVWEAN